MNRISKWDGSNWNMLGSGLDKEVERSIVYNVI